ncbi:MAG TPA: FadR family transcriptional regulator [Firmicutes bacterium]|nr:FadR family transcriptional regulator [Bacillota bacterium]
MEPVRKVMLYEEIARRIREHVQQNGMVPGSKLPSERDLAYQLGVSRNSVREALRILELQGLVTVRSGGGTFVSAVYTDGVSGLAEDVDAEPGTLLELQEVRRMFEVEAARLAALRAEAGDFARMEELVAATYEKAVRGRDVLQEDLAFHGAVVKATKNHVMERMYDTIVDLLIEVRKAGLSRSSSKEVAVQHEKVLSGIKSRNLQTAAQFMLEHLTSVEAGIRNKFGLEAEERTQRQVAGVVAQEEGGQQ